MREDLIGRSRRAAVKREKELRQRFLSSGDGAEHDDRAGLSLQAHIISGNDEEKVDGGVCEAEERSSVGTRQNLFFPPLFYNLYYIAPEVQGLIGLCQENPGAMDMWSLGIIVYFSGD
jgi:serine/threonine protein kinase